MQIKRCVWLGLLGLLLVATQGLTEPQQRGRGRGGPPGGDPNNPSPQGSPYDGQSRRYRGGDRGGPPSQDPSGDSQGRRTRGGDPSSFFDTMAKGKDVLIRAELDDRGQRFFDKIAEKLGITNGQITREQFANYNNMPRDDRKGMTPGGGGPPGSSADQGSRQGNWSDPASIASRAEESFRRHDKNGDGFLDASEMPEELHANLEMFDADHNGLIDLNEYKVFFQAKQEQKLVDRGASSSGYPGQMPAQPFQPPAARVVEIKPVVYHYDNLPKELPTWFKQLDTNHDAQIGLYEWRASGRPLSEFLAMDRNNDGFLTVEEVLAYQAKMGKGTSTTSPVLPSNPRGGLVVRAPSNP